MDETIFVIIKVQFDFALEVWFSILDIPQRQAPFRQFNVSHAILLSVILMVNMLSRSNSKLSRLFVCLTYPSYIYLVIN